MASECDKVTDAYAPSPYRKRESVSCKFTEVTSDSSVPEMSYLGRTGLLRPGSSSYPAILLPSSYE